MLFHCLFLLWIAIAPTNAVLRDFNPLIVNVRKCPENLHPFGDWRGVSSLTNFSISGQPSLHPIQQTTAYICDSAAGLWIGFDNVDNNATSSFTTCNQPLYLEHVVEMFLTGRHSGRAVHSEAIESDASEVIRVKLAEEQAIDLHHYTELELSPKGVLWAGHVTNPNLQCAGISHVLIKCESSGLQWGAKLLKAENKWKAFLFVPWKILDDRGALARPYYLKGNFFRISTPLGRPKEYSAYHTAAFQPAPCFHRPRDFIALQLD